MYLHEPGGVAHAQLRGEQSAPLPSLPFLPEHFRTQQRHLRGEQLRCCRACGLALRRRFCSACSCLSASKAKEKSMATYLLQPSALELTRKKLFERTSCKGCIQTMRGVCFCAWIRPSVTSDKRRMLQSHRGTYF